MQVPQQSSVLGNVVAEVKSSGRFQLCRKAFNHRGEVLEFAPSGTLEIVRFAQRVTHHLPQRAIVIGRSNRQAVHGCFSNATGRIIDHALEAFVVGGVGHQSEIGDEVFDFLALIETQAAIDAVGHVSFPKLFLKGARLSIGAVEDGEIFVVGLLSGAGRHDGVGDETALVVVAQCAVHIDFVAFVVAGPNVLLDLVLVFGNDGVGRFDNVFGAAVVLLKFVDHAIGIVPFKIENILDVGPPKAVDALRIVTHHTNVFPRCAKLADDHVLGEVGVLVLVDQDEAKLLLVLVQEIGKIPKKNIGLEQEVIEVHRS